MSDRFHLIEKKNFLSVNECNKLIDFYNVNIKESFTYRDTFPLDISANHIEQEPLLRTSIINILQECKKYDEKILVDACQIVKWPVNSFMKPHMDNDGDVFAALVYLNDNYVGGETCFEHTQVVPETGKLTIFSNTKLTHSVNMIKENTRYILALWFTNDFC